ncbi:hypothetical protein ABPG73_021278 [Tetrahymena malaccensis]
MGGLVHSLGQPYQFFNIVIYSNCIERKISLQTPTFKEFYQINNLLLQERYHNQPQNVYHEQKVNYLKNITVDNSNIYKVNIDTFSRLFKKLDIKGLQTYNPIKYNSRVIEINIPEIKKYCLNQIFNTTIAIFTINLIISQQKYFVVYSLYKNPQENITLTFLNLCLERIIIVQTIEGKIVKTTTSTKKINKRFKQPIEVYQDLNSDNKQLKEKNSEFKGLYTTYQEADIEEIMSIFINQRETAKIEA